MGSWNKVWAGLAIIIIVGFISMASYQSHDFSEYCNIYKATVPFGEFVSSGHVGGYVFFGFGGIRGEWAGEELYFVKFFDGDEIKTLTLDADKTPLIVDGTLRLELISTYYTGKAFFIWKWESPHERSYPPRYKIHIPYLPSVNQTLNNDWTP